METKLYRYKTHIHLVPDKGGAYVEFPYDIRTEFGKGRVKVHVTFDGIPYDGSIVNMGIKNENGDVCYIIGLLKSIREKLGKSEGDEIEVTVCEAKVFKNMLYIPESIKNIVGDEAYIRNGIGMSESDVFIFPKHVLKIQRHSLETDNEKDIAAWLKGCIPVPEIVEYCVENEIAYTLMTRICGKMLCDEELLCDPFRLIKYVAEGIKLLWSVSADECPYKVSRLDERLKQARFNVENGMVDLDNVEPDTFGANGFSNPEELINWLEHNRPQEDIVLTHGDFCLPNIFAANGQISGFIDLGKMGPADRWQDLAIVIRSLEHNFSGKYNGGKPYFKFEPQMLLDELGIEMDEAKYKYYKLLDELF